MPAPWTYFERGAQGNWYSKKVTGLTWAAWCAKGTLMFGRQNWIWITGDLAKGRKEILSSWHTQWCIFWTGKPSDGCGRGVGIKIPLNILCLRNFSTLKVEVRSGQCYLYTIYFATRDIKHVYPRQLKTWNLMCLPRHRARKKKTRHKNKLENLWHQKIDKNQKKREWEESGGWWHFRCVKGTHFTKNVDNCVQHRDREDKMRTRKWSQTLHS